MSDVDWRRPFHCPSAVSLALLLLFTPQLTAAAAKNIRTPFVVVPPSIRWNATNTVIVTPVATFSLVDIDIQVTSQPEGRTIFRQRLLSKEPGSPHPISFRVDGSSPLYRLKVQVSSHSPFQIDLRGRANVRRLHIQTDKLFYKPSETVDVRALPLTEEGQLFTGPVEYSLVNPEDFELAKHTVKADGRFARFTFELPEHLHFGEWRIFARPTPANSRNEDSFSTVIQVQDYELPAFSVFLEVDNSPNDENLQATVTAFYSHGGNVSGALTITCESKRHPESDKGYTPLIKQLPVVEGRWSGHLNLTQCLGGPKREIVTIIADVRDSGTGSRSVTKRTFDPLSPGFELIPLRPGYNTHTKVLPFLARALDPRAEDKELRVVATCLYSIPKDMKYAENKTLNAKVGDVFLVSLDNEWSMCPVIIIEAVRASSPRLRPSVVVMPSVRGNNTLTLSFINEDAVKKTYAVGSKFTVEVPVKPVNANFLAVCGGRDVAASGKVRDDGVISFVVTRQMVPQCVLFVYTVTRSPHTDMLLFHVDDSCEYSAHASKDVVLPGENVTIALKGEKQGLVSLQILDQRMHSLLEAAAAEPVKHWDLSFFNRPELKGDQARLINFLNATDVVTTIAETCKEAAVFYQLAFNNNCLEARTSASAVSDLCTQQMVAACNHTQSPHGAASCDPKSAACRSRNTLKGQAALPQVFRMILAQKPTAPIVSAAARGTQDDPIPESEIRKEAETHLREYFPHVWLFNDYLLGASGHKDVKLQSPDAITRWSVAARFWNPGRLDSCLAPSSTITTKKSYFMTVELPKNVYVNESITVKVSVSAENLNSEKRLSVCFTGLERMACGDEGVDGTLGEPTYSRVLISPSRPIDTKTFSLRFLAIGSLSLSFSLRSEESFPGKHHCQIGKLLDQVRLDVNVAKRAETEEHYKRLILNANKPVHTLTRMQFFDPTFVALDNDVHVDNARELIDYTEYRSANTPNAVSTEVHVNLPDTETIYSFTVEISKFLPHNVGTNEKLEESPLHENSIRAKRAIVEYGNSFLSDVLKQLATNLYAFKHLRVGSHSDLSFKAVERMENKIGSLLSDLLRFSDCRPKFMCGFNEYSRPSGPGDRSFLLTTLSTSLLCEADADEAIVCGALEQITTFARQMDKMHIELHNLIDLEKEEDKRWFMKGLLYQLANDCASYSCVRNDNVWTKLYRDFYQLDENFPLDTRTVAALAFLGPNNTNDIMRLKMYSSLKENMMPYWTAGASSHPVFDKLRHGYELLYNIRKIKSGDVLVNSLGMLAFVGKGVEATKQIDFDSLADWLNEQQNSDDTYASALDTYFASRALYEFRQRKVSAESAESLSVEVRCVGCETRAVNVSVSPTIIYVPVGVKNVTLVTRGEGKVKAGLRVLASRRQRSRRELAVDYYPVHISVEQEKFTLGNIKQIVCLRIFSPVLTKVEITHGLFTGFTTAVDKIFILENSTKLEKDQKGLELVRRPELSAYAAHLLFTGLRDDRHLCYSLGLVEPSSAHEPGNLAPVAITARHPINDVIGQVFISHPDIGRARRDAEGADSIETVCFAGGNCACAETTCDVKCGQCSRASEQDLKTELCRPGAFGATVEVLSITRAESDGAAYRVLNVTIHHWLENGAQIARPEHVELWLRECNVRCLKRELKPNTALIFVGHESGFVTDIHAKLHYVLRNADRLEQIDESCSTLASFILRNDGRQRCST